MPTPKPTLRHEMTERLRRPWAAVLDCARSNVGVPPAVLGGHHMATKKSSTKVSVKDLKPAQGGSVKGGRLKK